MPRRCNLMESVVKSKMKRIPKLRVRKKRISQQAKRLLKKIPINIHQSCGKRRFLKLGKSILSTNIPNVLLDLLKGGPFSVAVKLYPKKIAQMARTRDAT